MAAARESTARARGFSLIELLVVMSIIAVLLAILVPVLASARRAAGQVTCLSNIRQVVTAVHTFTIDHRGRLPENRTLVSPTEYVTWRHLFAAERRVPEDTAWACPLHPGGARHEIGFFEDGARCVSDVASSYALNGHLLWRFEKTQADAEESDVAIRRPSHTILIAESNLNHPDLRVIDPLVQNAYGADPGPYAYWHDRAGNYAFYDGHAETLKFLDTGGPDCRWHNGEDLTEDPLDPVSVDELGVHDHPEWGSMVPRVYR
ncbi:MAG: type II secretion system protein [Planctomycetota bacterium]